MIEVQSPANSRVLIVGNDSLTDAVIRDLKSFGIEDITLINNESPRQGVEVKQYVKKDILSHTADDVTWFRSFSLIVALNQPRPLELALSNMRWPSGTQDSDPDLPLIISRSVQNTCKMRCQYRELPLNSGGSSTFVHLEMDLLPWTDAKRTLIASTIRSEFLTGDQHVQFHRYLTAGRAVVEFQRSTGAWPTEANAPQIKASADREAHAFVDQMCKGGLGSVPETIELIGRLISADALKILTGSGHPINNVNVEEAILIATAQ